MAEWQIERRSASNLRARKALKKSQRNGGNCVIIDFMSLNENGSFPLGC